MKKNNMLRIASVLLVAVLLSTCAISGAFAKYYTDGSASDSARVAAFGITVSAEGEAFLAAYDTDNDEIKTTIAQSVIGLDTTDDDVDNPDKVVAPGTTHDLGSFGIEGTAEVAVTVAKTATLTLTGWEANGDYYCPIKITFTKGTVETNDDITISGLDFTSAAAFKEAVEGAITLTENYAPNTTFAEANSYSWTWDFTGDDAKDTALGRLATAPTVELAVEITVTQID